MCVKLFETPEKGCCWRTPAAYAVPAREGERYELTGWMRPETASGRNYMAILFCNAGMQVIQKCETESATGAFTWRKYKALGAAPKGTTDVMAGCFSEDNRVAVLFDDLSLVRVK